jgi:hypothetical protein
MTDHPRSSPVSGHVNCEVCLKEVPTSAAVNFEANDYVAHFCGLECYAQWKGRSDDQAKSEQPPVKG